MPVKIWVMFGVLAFVAFMFIQTTIDPSGGPKFAPDRDFASAGPARYRICFTARALVCNSYEEIARSTVVTPGSGCSMINRFVAVGIVDGRGSYVKVETQPPYPRTILWINRGSVECEESASPGKSAPLAPEFSSEITGDGFVWKEGKRIGWVDRRGPAFYWLNQLDLHGDRAPVPKADATGWDVSRENTRRDVDEFLKAPKEKLEAAVPGIEKTGDGFVWRSGRRIGWVDGARSVFFPMPQLDVVAGVAVPRAGADGFAIARGDLESAVRRSEVAP